MKPTQEQIKSITSAYFHGPHDQEEAIGCAIAYWESIRPPCGDCDRLQAILADPNAVRLNMLRGTIAWTPETLRSVLGEAALPEWIPASEKRENKDCVLWMCTKDDSFTVDDYTASSQGWTHFLPLPVLMGLPKRQVAVNAEMSAEEEVELDAAWVKEWEGPNAYQESDRITFEAGWKAARAGR